MRSRIVYGTNGARKFFLEDREVTEQEYRDKTPNRINDALAAGETLPGHSTSGWPLRSEALAVHPDQVREANERNKRHGIGTRYDRDGTAVIPDRGDRRRLLRVEGMYDRHGGYGD